jgi:hypothetical protein
MWPRNSFSGNICFEISVLVLCSVVRWACHAGTRDFVLPWLLSSVQNKKKFLTVHYFNSLGQAAVLGCLSLSINVSGG